MRNEGVGPVDYIHIVTQDDCVGILIKYGNSKEERNKLGPIGRVDSLDLEFELVVGLRCYSTCSRAARLEPRAISA